MTEPEQVDVAVVGAGAAGDCLVDWLSEKESGIDKRSGRTDPQKSASS